MDISTAAVKQLVELIDRLYNPFFFRKKATVDVRKAQLQLLQELSQSGVDPKLFDAMLSNELDRELKKQFGVAFFVATVAFTGLSYGIVVGNGYYKWGISDWAITALIIETPLQFIGLLYIIARNLFPQTPSRKLEGLGRIAPRKAKSRADGAEANGAKARPASAE